MSSLGRSRRGHLSKKIANVKLRPSGAASRASKVDEEAAIIRPPEDINLMDTTTARVQADQSSQREFRLRLAGQSRLTLPRTKPVV